LNLDLTLIIKRVILTSSDVAFPAQISEMADRAKVLSSEFDNFEEEFALNCIKMCEERESGKLITLNHLPLTVDTSC
jgi:hypothetical protein